VALLGIALGAMILGCILLLIILYGYDFSTRVSLRTPPSLAATGRPLLTVHPGTENFFTERL
jgi:hypothetical protein